MKKKTTLQDMRDILVNSSEGSDRHIWGVVTRKNTNPQGKVTSYEVALGGDEGSMTCRKLAGADVGDTVMVTLTKKGSAIVTGTVDGDKDAENALTAATEAQQAVDDMADAVDDLEELVGDGDESGITITTQYYLSTSNTTPTGGSWQDTLPTYVAGRYYWTKTVTTYADGSEVESEPILDIASQLTAEVNSVVTAENQHFWHDNTGAYVTTANKSYASGYAMKITSYGLLQTYNGNNLMSLTTSGLTFYQSNGSTPMASYSSSGATIYGGSSNYVSINSNGMTIVNGGKTAAIYASGSFKFYNTSGSVMAQFSTPSTGKGSLIFGDSGGRLSGDSYFMGISSGSYSITANSSSGYIDMSFPSSSSYGFRVTQAGTVLLQAKDSKVYVPAIVGNNVSTYNIGAGSAYGLGIYSSSRDKKTDISYEIEDEFDPHQLYNLPVVTFRWKDEYKDQDAWDKDRKQIGFIAEDVHDVYYVGAIHDSTGKTIDWSHRTIIPAMLKLIQEQHDEIELLKRRN